MEAKAEAAVMVTAVETLEAALVEAGAAMATMAAKAAKAAKAALVETVAVEGA